MCSNKKYLLINEKVTNLFHRLKCVCYPEKFPPFTLPHFTHCLCDIALDNLYVRQRVIQYVQQGGNKQYLNRCEDSPTIFIPYSSNDPNM